MMAEDFVPSEQSVGLEGLQRMLKAFGFAEERQNCKIAAHGIFDFDTMRDRMVGIANGEKSDPK